MTVRGNSVTIWERRRPLDGSPGQWTRMKSAQLRHNPSDATWALYWSDRRGWQLYFEAGTSLDKALQAIHDDPLGAFFG